MALILPRAIVLRTIAAYASFSSGNSAEYFAPPVTFRRPSTRSNGFPIAGTGISAIAITGSGNGGSTRRRDTQGANDRTPCQLHLESIMFVGLCVAQSDACSGCERGFVGRSINKRLLSFLAPPRLMRDTAERDSRGADLVAFELQRCRDRYQCEGVGCAVANFEIA